MQRMARLGEDGEGGGMGGRHVALLPGGDGRRIPDGDAVPEWVQRLLLFR